MGNGIVFQTVKSALPISGDGYDADIITQIKAAALDLTKTAEIVLPGEISITRTLTQQQTGVLTTEPAWVITDNSTLTDELVLTAIATWCNMRIGNPPNYDNLLKAYESIKGSLRISSAYTHYDGGGEDDAEDDQL